MADITQQHVPGGVHVVAICAEPRNGRGQHRRYQGGSDASSGGPLSLLDRELRDKRFLLGEEISGADHFLFMMGLWCENAPQPISSFANLLRFMREISQRPAVQNVCEIEQIDLSCYA